MTRHVEFQRLHNFRDLGGYATADAGATKWGVLFRSDNLRKLSESADVERFRALDVRTVIDLRYPWEIEQSGRVPELPGLRYVNLSIEHQPYDQGALGDDFDPWRFLADRYMEVAQDGVFGAPKEPMKLFIADLTSRYGSVEGYAEQELGVGGDLVGAMKAKLVDVEG